DLAVDHRADLLQVRVAALLGLVVRVADVVADQRALAADVTLPSHGRLLQKTAFEAEEKRAAEPSQNRAGTPAPTASTGPSSSRCPGRAAPPGCRRAALPRGRGRGAPRARRGTGS